MCIPFREQLQAKDQRISTLEAELAEAQDKARLQRALDAINTGDYYIELYGKADDWNIQLNQALGNWMFQTVSCPSILIEANGFTPLEAAEAAAQWAESQKEAAHE